MDNEHNLTLLLCIVLLCSVSKVVCKYLSFQSTVSDYQLLHGISQAAKVYYNYTGNTPCLNTSQTATGNLGFLGWYYQVSAWEYNEVKRRGATVNRTNRFDPGMQCGPRNRD